MIKPKRPVFMEEHKIEHINPDEDTAIWANVADETAAIFLDAANPNTTSILTESPLNVKDALLQKIQNDDIEDIATLWSRSPSNCLAGMLWRSYIIYLWLEQSEETLISRFVNGINTPVKSKNPVDYKEITELLRKVMQGKLSETGKTIQEFFSDMTAFLRILAIGVSFDDENIVFIAREKCAEILTLKAKSLLVLAKEFEDASTWV